MMLSPSPRRRVSYTHPSLPRLPMTGVVEFDPWEGLSLFYPDDVFEERLADWYGYDATAGLYLDGASVSPLSP